MLAVTELKDVLRDTNPREWKIIEENLEGKILVANETILRLWWMPYGHGENSFITGIFKGIEKNEISEDYQFVMECPLRGYSERRINLDRRFSSLRVLTVLDLIRELNLHEYRF